jgi:phosphopantetheine--protein transferase-like protein
MPILLKQELADGGELGVWEITEPVQYFADRLDLHPSEAQEVASLNDRKQLEWMASRYLLHLMSGRAVRGACLKDDHGKPYLVDSDYHISMSHSRTMVAVVASPHDVGIDIQVIVEKIGRIAKRFLTPEELDRIEPSDHTEVLHVLWGAKESLYKAYGKRQLDFKQHIWTDSIVYKPHGCQTKGGYSRGNEAKTFDIFAQQINNYILVYAVADS